MRKEIKAFEHSETFVELLDFDLADLWRLKAQKGRFLYLPFTNFERYFEIDRVNFPFSKNFPLIDEANVFPDRKSPLETIIDDYFDNEKVLNFNTYIREDPDIKIVNLPLVDESNRVISKQINVHESWNGQSVNSWKRSTNIPIPASRDFEKIRLNIKFTYNYSELYTRIIDQVDSALHNINDLNAKYLKWEIEFSNRKKIKAQLLGLYWDGIKSFPFSLESIVYGFSNCIILQLAPKPISFFHNDKFVEYITNLWGPILPIELESDSARSRAFVSISELKTCVRPDIENYIKSKNLIEEDIFEFLMSYNKVKFIFDFDKLCQLFLRQIVPSQIVRNNGIGTFINSPSNLHIIGIP